MYRYWHNFSRNLVLISTSNFFTDIKIAQTRRASAIYSLWKICKCLLHQIAREIMLLLVDNLNETTSSKSVTEEILKACARAICNFHSCYNFALLETALVFSQSEARNFFMFIINQESLNQKARKRLRTHSFNKVRLYNNKVFI